MSRPLLAATLLVLGLSLPATAGAVQLGKSKPGSALHGATLSVNETFYYKLNLFLDDNEEDAIPPPFTFHEFVNRTSVDLRINRFTLGAQVDLVWTLPNCGEESYREAFAERFGEDTTCRAANPVRGSGWKEGSPEPFLARLEKVYLRYRMREANRTATQPTTS